MVPWMQLSSHDQTSCLSQQPLQGESDYFPWLMVSMPVYLHQSIFVTFKPSSLYATFGCWRNYCQMVICNNRKTWPPVSPGHPIGSVQLSSVHSQPPETGAAPLLTLPRNGHSSRASSNDTTLLSTEASWASGPAQSSKKQVAMHTDVQMEVTTHALCWGMLMEFWGEMARDGVGRTILLPFMILSGSLSLQKSLIR